MRTASEYEFECLCGHKVVTFSAYVTCPNCGREIRIDWGAKDVQISGKPVITQTE